MWTLVRSPRSKNAHRGTEGIFPFLRFICNVHFAQNASRVKDSHGTCVMYIAQVSVRLADMYHIGAKALAASILPGSTTLGGSHLVRDR